MVVHLDKELAAQLKRDHEAAYVTMNKLSERTLQFDPDVQAPGRRFNARPFSEGGGVMSIVLDAGTHVWVSSCYAFNLDAWPEIVQVGDGRTNGHDKHGNCVHSVPAEWCEFRTPEEAESIMTAHEADEAMRANCF